VFEPLFSVFDDVFMATKVRKKKKKNDKDAVGQQAAPAPLTPEEEEQDSRFLTALAVCAGIVVVLFAVLQFL